MITRLLSIILIIILLFGCSKHQYFTYSSDLSTNEKGFFHHQDDSLYVSYRFLGDKTIELELTNNSEKLIFVDWSKSSIIYGDESLPFVDHVALLNGTTSGQIINGNSYGNISGTIEESTSRTYIPPNSKTIRQFAKLPVKYVNHLKKTYSFEHVLLPSEAKRFKFSDSYPASIIKSFLYVTTSDEKNSAQYSHSFWVSEIVETMDGSLQSQRNQLKQTKKTATGSVLTTVGVIGLIAVAISLDEGDQ